MRIGFDIDGVLANFTTAFIQETIRIAGKNLFLPEDSRNPPDWNYHLTRGYTEEEIKPVFASIAASPNFWLDLKEEPGCSTLRMCILDLQRFHDVYFVTNRQGEDAKWQTEQWLLLHLGIERPTVLISKEKGLVARALKLDCYLDDNLENANDVVLRTLPSPVKILCGVPSCKSLPQPDDSPSCRTYLLDRSYNQSRGPGNGPQDDRVTRVKSVGEFLDYELKNF